MEAIPWDRLLVDPIEPFKIRREGLDETIILEALTIIDLITMWIKSHNKKYTGRYNSKTSSVNTVM